MPPGRSAGLLSEVRHFSLVHLVRFDCALVLGPL